MTALAIPFSQFLCTAFSLDADLPLRVTRLSCAVRQSGNVVDSGNTRGIFSVAEAQMTALEADKKADH